MNVAKIETFERNLWSHCKIKAGFFEGRRSFKKRILTKTRQENDYTNSNEDNESLLEIACEDDGNIFDMLEDM